MEDDDQTSNNKSVNFSKVVRVCLIPRREEFEPIKHHVWWGRDNLVSGKWRIRQFNL